MVAGASSSRSRWRPCSPPRIGWLSVRTEGIYTIMITLAIGVAFFYLAQQNYTLFNGFQGFSRIAPPTVLGIDFREPMPFYFLVLACALAGYFFVKHLVARAFRHRAAGHPRQPAPHAGAGLRRHGAPGRRLCGGGLPGGGRRRADGLVQRPHLARPVAPAR